MITEPELKPVISNKLLARIFIVSVAIYIIFNLPVSLMGQQLKSNGFQYAENNGSLWNAHFSNLVTQGRIWQNAHIEPHILSFITGNVAADFKLDNTDEFLTGKFSIGENDSIHLNKLSGMTKTSFSINNQILTSNLSFDADEVILDHSGNCQSGVMNIKSDVLDQFQNDFGIQLPPLFGQGQCHTGIISVLMQSETDGIHVTFRGDYSGSRQMGQLSIQLPSLLENNPQIVAKLQSLGFEKTSGLWQVDTKVEIT